MKLKRRPDNLVKGKCGGLTNREAILLLSHNPELILVSLDISNDLLKMVQTSYLNEKKEEFDVKEIFKKSKVLL